MKVFPTADPKPQEKVFLPPKASASHVLYTATRFGVATIADQDEVIAQANRALEVGLARLLILSDTLTVHRATQAPCCR